MLNNSIILLTCSWKESWYINKADDRNIESIAESYESCSLTASINIKYTCVSSWLISNNTNTLTIEASKTSNDVLRKFRLNLKEFTIISYGCNNLIHIICLIRIFRNYLVKNIFLAIDRVITFCSWSFFCVVRRDI